MERIFNKLKDSLRHMEILHEVFKNKKNFSQKDISDWKIYVENADKFSNMVNELNFEKQLYKQKDRQMILADLIEYIFLGRGYYSIQNKGDTSNFIKLILYFVNLLMGYEVITASKELRTKLLKKFKLDISQISDEEYFDVLLNHSGTIGFPKSDASNNKKLSKYFDSLLPKTAGGLWHELLVFIFLLRNNIGYIMPMLLIQRLISMERYIIPPDFLVITFDKHIYGVEVGRKKEIQSGTFSLQTAIPTATVDTENSRVSDRCPICHKWIPFCDYVIRRYADLDVEILKSEVRCLNEPCDLYSVDEITAGACPYSKYSRKPKKTLPHTQHKFADGKHYHYTCILNNVPRKIRKAIIKAKDPIALKTHYPYYQGLEELM